MIDRAVLRELAAMLFERAENPNRAPGDSDTILPPEQVEETSAKPVRNIVCISSIMVTEFSTRRSWSMTKTKQRSRMRTVSTLPASERVSISGRKIGSFIGIVGAKDHP